MRHPNGHPEWHPGALSAPHRIKRRLQRIRQRQSRQALSTAWFKFVTQHHLIYNACWEDPRLDRWALHLGPHDTLLTITSAGCNVLDYALLGPKHIYAVDLNYRQNALLELKLAGIRHLEFETFFRLFGRGYLEDYRTIYQQRLRTHLSPPAQGYWDRHIDFFSGKGWRHTFYFYGTSGLFVRFLHTYATHIAKIRDSIEALCQARSLDEQGDIYHRALRPVFTKGWLRWLVGRDTTLSLLGVPRPQRDQVERHYHGGIVQFMEDCADAVFTLLPMWENYFWQLYLRGAYTPECCPEYLKRDNFVRLQAGLVDRISVHTCSLTDFLLSHNTAAISRVVLLDHMDWLSTMNYPALQQEWQALVDHVQSNTRLLWRSGGLQVDYVDPITVVHQGRQRRVGELLTYHHDLAATLHPQDRVHTYGSFYIADLMAA
jgi:S-adenosylmethionine-diacylglycerol 3-amino-3-carboxypropyl transferase